MESARKVLKIVIPFIIIGVIVSHVYSIISWKDTTGDYLSSYKQLYSTPENTIEVAFLGSSHVYSGIYPSIIWENSRIPSFDMSVSGMDRESSVYALKELYKTQHPKLVVLDLYGIFIDEQLVEANKYRNLLGMKFSINSNELIMNYSNIDEDDRLDYFFRWPIVHTRYTELEKYDFIDNPESIYGKGARYDWSTTHQEIPDVSSFMTDDIEEISISNKEWIDSINKITSDNGSELMLVMIPTSLNLEQQKKINGAMSYAEKLDIPHYDLNRVRAEIGIDENKDFYDYDHLNALGAEKTTSYLTGIIDSSHELNKATDEEKYISWVTDFKNYQHKKFEEEIYSMSVEDRMTALINGEDIITIISISAGADSDDINLVLSKTDINNEDLLLGGKWIYENSALDIRIDNNTSDKKIYELDDYNYIAVSGNLDTKEKNMEINKSYFVTPNSGVMVLAYDKFLNRIIYEAEWE